MRDDYWSVFEAERGGDRVYQGVEKVIEVEPKVMGGRPVG